MSDISVNSIETIHVGKLIPRLEQSNDPIAREAGRRLAQVIERPDRRVADAFGIEPSRDRRDGIVRNLAGEGSLRKQASTILQKARRYRPHPADRVIGGERSLLWQLHQIGSLDLSERQIRRILGGR